MSSLERGLENPTVSELDKLAKALSIPIADFFQSPIARRATSKAAFSGTQDKDESDPIGKEGSSLGGTSLRCFNVVWRVLGRVLINARCPLFG
ncbi:helix-turn-helix transcriptional regulator [Bradyrhizobium sp. AUGA SZCCT0431]|uniref:helix-turn-helix domain-containing protein n=1 Tax=Bradyrhizobium sp. AUGA SZCCT0431 TaxID=2807674 RepID=UPI0028A0F1C4|nr:helix-turn-helix transcriptional regulator [Bradyrhizobium sp. AUGA SZCCT0431]